MGVDLINRLVYDALINARIKDIDTVISHVKEYLEGRVTEGVNEEDIEREVINCIENTIPQWIRLGIIEKNVLS